MAVARRKLFGIDPSALDGLLQERQEQHRIALDQLRARMTVAQGRLTDLRSRRAELQASLARLEAEAQTLLQEMQQLGAEQERPLRALADRHGRERSDQTEGLRLIQQERDGWVELERRMAEGIMAAVELYLEAEGRLPPSPPSTDAGGGTDG